MAAWQVGMNLGVVLKERGRYADAARWLRGNLASKQRALGERHADTCFTALNLCSVWVDGRSAASKPTGRAEAEELREADELREAVELATTTHSVLCADFGESHPSALSASMHVGAALHACGQSARAVVLLRRVLAAQTAAHGERHPDALESAWRLGAALITAGGRETCTDSEACPDSKACTDSEARGAACGDDIEEAVALLRATASHYEAQVGSSHPRTLRALVGLGEALLVRGGEASVAEAARVLPRCHTAQCEALETGHRDLQRTQNALAKLAATARAGGHGASGGCCSPSERAQ